MPRPAKRIIPNPALKEPVSGSIQLVEEPEVGKSEKSSSSERNTEVEKNEAEEYQPLQPYTHIEAFGLKKAVELNGQHGHIVQYNPKSDLYNVIFNWDTKTKKALKRKNLKVVEEFITPPSWDGWKCGIKPQDFGVSDEHSKLLQFSQEAFDEVSGLHPRKQWDAIQRHLFIRIVLDHASEEEYGEEGLPKGQKHSPDCQPHKIFRYIMTVLMAQNDYEKVAADDRKIPSVYQCQARFQKEFVHRFKIENQKEVDDFLVKRETGEIQKKYEIREMGNPGRKHYGVFATEAIEPLEIILIEDPVLTVKLEKGQKVANAQQVTGAFNKLSEDLQEKVMELHGPPLMARVGQDGTLEQIHVENYGEHMVHIFQRNSLQQVGAQHLYLEMSRFNHSCSPNIFLSGDTGAILGNGSNSCFRALRRIEAGEQFCWDYCENMIFYEEGMAIMTKAERQSHIESRHLFKCHCPECELTGAALRRSNNDRKRFKSLVHPVNGAFPPDFHLFTTMYSSVTEEQLPKAQMQKLAPKMQFLAPKMQFLFPAGSIFPAGNGY